MLSKDKIKWRCRRGILELDVIFTRFLEERFDKLNQEALEQLDALLALPDPLLQQWLIYGKTPDQKFKKIIEMILI